MFPFGNQSAQTLASESPFRQATPQLPGLGRPDPAASAAHLGPRVRLRGLRCRVLLRLLFSTVWYVCRFVSQMPLLLLLLTSKCRPSTA